MSELQGWRMEPFASGARGLLQNQAVRSPHAPSRPKFLGLWIGALALVACGSSVAAPDAGAQLRRIQDETQNRLRPDRSADSVASLAKPSRAKTAVAAAGDTRISITSFALHGVTQFGQGEVSELLKPFLGREMDTQAIYDAADALTLHYRKAGFFLAKVFVPPQSLSGSLALDVHEGLLDRPGLEVVNLGARVESSVVQRILEANISQDSPAQRREFERALLIAEDLPGVTTSSLIYPGEHVGTARLRVTLHDLPLFSGNVDVDNFGSKSTGQFRLGSTMYLNSPSQIGDQWVGRLVSSGRGSNYAFLNYLLPLSPRGMRVGASIDHFSYRASAIEILGHSEGSASDTRLYLTHPLIRSRHGNLNLRADLSQLSVEDRNDLQINAKRRVRTASMALHGDDDHEWLGTGLSIVDLLWSTGTVDVQGNTSYQTIDQATSNTSGRFTRMNLQLSRLQQLSRHWAVFGKLGAQWASKNLDSTQKFYLGGATSVSGYPVGEAGGDQGYEVAAELRRDFSPPWEGTLMTALFYQQGSIYLHKRVWPNWQGSNPLIRNQFSLKSMGVNLTLTLPQQWVLRGSIAWQIGSNPMRNPTSGAASDGKADAYRAWMQAIRYF